MMNEARRSPMSRAWATVGLLWFVAMLNYLDRLTITTMHDSLMSDIAMNEAQFGLLTSVFLWVYAAVSPFGGFLADRLSRTRVIIASLLVWSVVTWLTGMCHTVGQLIVVRALMGISEACYIPAGLALIADYHSGRTRSLATGIHISGVYAGVAMGGVGGVIASYFGWQASFYIFGAFGIVYSFVLMLFLRDAPVRETPQGTSHSQEVHFFSALKSLLVQPSYCALFVHASLLSVASWGICGWLPTYLKEHFNMGQGAAGLSATGYLQAASFVGILVGGTWADSWIRKNVRGRLFVPMIGFIVASPALFMATSTDVFVMAIAGLLVYGIARGFSDANMMPILCQIADPRYRATGYGFMNFCTCIAGGIMIYVGGVLKDHHVELGVTFRWAATGLFVAALLLLLIKPKREMEES